MIKNVIFDSGDVLINNNPLEYIKKLGYSDEKTEALYQALSTDTVWHDKDIGIYEARIACHLYSKNGTSKFVWFCNN